MKAEGNIQTKRERELEVKSYFTEFQFCLYIVKLLYYKFQLETNKPLVRPDISYFEEQLFILYSVENIRR